MKNLGRLKKVELRNIWNHEAHDFTCWLASPENIELLGDEIGFELTNVQTEYPIGRYNVDLVAFVEETQQKVIIENQLELTDHRHLGQIFTYAAGYGAEIVIWIVKDVREEHQKAVEWLNDISSEKLNFFLIRMELWQIGDSMVAPKFLVVVEPNDWAKQIKTANTEPKELTDTKQLQKEFWTQFVIYAKEKGTSLRIGRKVRAQHWYDISIGTSEAHISCTINTREGIIEVQLYIPRSQELYQHFFEHKEAIEGKLGYPLEWMPLEGKTASRIKVIQDAPDFDQEEAWPTYFAWLKQTAEQFAQVFGKYIK